MSTLRGGCLCGAVIYQITLPTLWCAHCHCSMCRLSHGAGYVTWFGVADPQFRIIEGDDAMAWHQSSPPAQRAFCKRCGTRLFFRSKRWPGETHVTLASLHEPLDRVPESHVFYASHVDWAPVGDALPRHYQSDDPEARATDH